MENTNVFIVGDHGYVGLYGLYKILKSKDWEIESSLPIFIMITFDKKNLSYYEQYNEIKKNQQNFITPFDIYFTLSHILYGNEYEKIYSLNKKKYGENLFRYINSYERNCKKYKYLTSECQCK